MADAMDSHTQIELSEDNMKYIATCLSDQFSKSGPVMNDDQFEKLSTRVVESVMLKFDDKIKSLQEENLVLRGRVITLENQMDAANQYSRRNSLRISRVDEFVGTPLPQTSEGMATLATFAGAVSKPKKTPLMSREDTDAYVLKMCHDLGVKMSINDIDRSHRSGKIGPTKSRDILVKFATYRARNRLYTARSSAKDKGYADIYVNEDLTSERSHLLYVARQLVKANELSQAWSHDGTILFKRTGSDTILRANNATEFTTLCPAFAEEAAKIKKNTKK